MQLLRPTLMSLALLLAACDATPPPAATSASAPTAAAPAVVATPAAPPTLGALEAKLKKGMPYEDLRREVLAAGWLPLAAADCKEMWEKHRVGCWELAELQRCDAGHRCTMGFARGATQPLLRVDTDGDPMLWGFMDDKNGSNMMVADWSLRRTEATAPRAAQCPSQDFKAFLAAFAGNKSTQRAFTLPLVKVADMATVKEDDVYYDAYVRAADYRGFILDHRSDGFYVVPAVGEPSRVEPDIDMDGASAYLVTYRYGIGEGNSFRFEKHDGCWYLAADPEPPSA